MTRVHLYVQLLRDHVEREIRDRVERKAKIDPRRYILVVSFYICLKFILRCYIQWVFLTASRYKCTVFLRPFWRLFVKAAFKYTACFQIKLFRPTWCINASRTADPMIDYDDKLFVIACDRSQIRTESTSISVYLLCTFAYRRLLVKFMPILIGVSVSRNKWED